VKSNFAEHILNTGHNYTNVQPNLQTLYKTHNGPILNALEQFKCIETKNHTGMTS